MKKTQFIELFKNIKATLVSFISILMFVGLSIGIFLGISWTGTSIKKSIDNAIEKTNMYDTEYMFIYGFDDEDIKEIEKIDGVDEIEKIDLGYHYIYINNEKYQSVVMNVSKKISTPVLVSGRMPEKIGDILMDASFAKKHNLSIGDTVIFENDDDELLRNLNTLYYYDIENNDVLDIKLAEHQKSSWLLTDTFTICGFSNTPRYISTDESCYGVSPLNFLPINLCVYIGDESIDYSAGVGHTDILVRNNDFAGQSYFDEEYKNSLDEWAKETRIKMNEIALEKCHKLKNKLNDIEKAGEDKLEEALADINEAEDSIKKSKRELADSKTKLDDALVKLNSNEAEYEDGLEEYENSCKQYSSEYSQYISFNKIVFVEGEFSPESIITNQVEVTTYLTKQLSSLQKQGKTEACEAINGLLGLISTPGWNLVEPSKTIAKDGFTSICGVFEQTFASLKAQLDSAEDDLNDARYLLDEGWNEYNDGLKKYNEGIRKLKDAESDLAKAKEDYQKGVENLEEYKEKTKDIQDFEVVATSRTTNAGLMVGNVISNMLGKLRFSMASLFLIVALFVCYSSISRIVYDQMVLIGTKKALGLSKKEVTRSYLIYTGLAVLIGCIIGVALGYGVITKLLLKAMSNSFTVPLNRYTDLREAIMLCAFEIILLLAITYFACNKILKKDTIKLLQGENTGNDKVRFYEKTKLWKKLPLLSKTIVNNCVNDPRRVLGTIVGIAGSTALIVTALTLNHNIIESFDKQYRDYFHFNQRIDYSTNQARDEIKQLLDKEEIVYANIFYTRIATRFDDGRSINTQVHIVNNVEDYKKMVSLDISKGNIEDEYKGLWFADSYLNYYKDPEKYIKLTTYDGSEAEIKPSGYFKYHLANYQAIMDGDTYRNNFGDFEENSFLINIDDEQAKELLPKLKNIDGFVALANYYSQSKTSYDIFKVLSGALVVIYVILAIIMACLVLLNLLTMFVEEKKRELIILMINGYYLKDVRRYIYLDTIFLTILGVIFGVTFGSFMGNFAVKSFESECTLFIHSANAFSCLAGAAGAALLTFLISLKSLKNIEKFKLTDINKS